MTKFTKVFSLLLVFIMVLNIGVIAAENPAETETTDVTEVTTTLPEETTANVEEETTTEATDETTTVPEEETTVPEVTEPDATEPTEPEVTEPTEPEKPDVTLPAAPDKVEAGNYSYGRMRIDWNKVDGADGYNIYIKKDGEWTLVESDKIKYYTFDNLLYNSKYEVGVKSYITVEGEKYLSEDMATTTLVTPAEVPEKKFSGGMSSRNTIDLFWYLDGGVSGYVIYLRKDNKWVKLATTNNDSGLYKFEKALPGKTYKFGIKAFVKGTEGTVYSKLSTMSVLCEDYSKTEVKTSSVTNSTVTVKWGAVDGADSYRVYIYKNGKWSYYKGIKKTSYKITGLEASTKYKIKVKPCFKADGEVVWGTYSDTVSVTTKSKTVKAYRVSKLKKNFTDGDWSVKLTGLDDGVYGKLDYTLAVKGNKIFVKYDYKNNSSIRDFKYIINLDTGAVNVIFDDDKTYMVVKGEEAQISIYSALMMALVLDMSSAKGVTAKTTVYSGKTAVAEIYQDNELEAKKTFYFINDEIKALKVTYSDGTTETMKISNISDTPSSSLFSIPKGYKKIAY